MRKGLADESPQGRKPGDTEASMGKGQSESQGGTESRASMLPEAEATEGLTEGHRVGAEGLGTLSTPTPEGRAKQGGTESGVHSPGHQLPFERLVWKNGVVVLVVRN